MSFRSKKIEHKILCLLTLSLSLTPLIAPVLVRNTNNTERKKTFFSQKRGEKGRVLSLSDFAARIEESERAFHLGQKNALLDVLLQLGFKVSVSATTHHKKTNVAHSLAFARRRHAHAHSTPSSNFKTLPLEWERE